MRKIFYCIIPFILIWGLCISLFIPQFTHEYLGTVVSDSIVEIREEFQSGNTYKTRYTYEFEYKDKCGVTRSSKKMKPNLTMLNDYPGFTSTSTNDWRVKQLLKNNKVYAAGFTWYAFVIFLIAACCMPPYIGIIVFGEHIECLARENNYACGADSYCFGCPFCVTDQQTITQIHKDLIKPKEKFKRFFGY